MGERANYESTEVDTIIIEHEGTHHPGSTRRGEVIRHDEGNESEHRTGANSAVLLLPVDTFTANTHGNKGGGDIIYFPL